MDFLSDIITVRRKRVAAAKRRRPLDQVRAQAREICASRTPHIFAEAMQDNRRINLIAEFKRRSPSKGNIKIDADPATIAQHYESGGAAAISVLTEEDHFAGSLEDLHRVREVTSLPILRKDFIVDEYQVYESAAAGADAILLIVAALEDEDLTRLRELAEDELGLDALVEVHTKEEFDRAVLCGAQLIGVNNRDLRTFKVSTRTSLVLAAAAPRSAILITESGLTPQAVNQLRDAGYRGFLVGEALMRAEDPAQALLEFTSEAKPSGRSVWVKICGITNREDAFAAYDAGADMLGFNFYRRSPRFIKPAAAREIVEALRAHRDARREPPMMIGVFVNETIEKVVRISEDVKLNGIQLHGDETTDYCRRLREASPRRFVIKALASSSGEILERARNYSTEAIMLDAFDPRLRGGTGRLANWHMARQIVARSPRVFLAGGLSPENVADAIASVQPYAVDACSSLEISPGRKSAVRMKQFVQSVRASKLPGTGSH